MGLYVFEALSRGPCGGHTEIEKGSGARAEQAFQARRVGRLSEALTQKNGIKCFTFVNDQLQQLETGWGKWGGRGSRETG